MPHKLTKSRKQLLLLLLAFLLPVLLAKALLSSGFKGEVKTHGGQLLSTNITYQQLFQPVANEGVTADKTTSDKQWKLIYLTSKPCHETCFNQLYHIQQTYKALGRLQDRVTLAVLAKNTPQDYPQRVSKDLFVSHQVSLNIANEFDDTVLIVDPLGNLVMSYQFDNNKQQSLVKAHDILLDIKQLLKLSRIG